MFDVSGSQNKVSGSLDLKIRSLDLKIMSLDLKLMSLDLKIRFLETKNHISRLQNNVSEPQNKVSEPSNKMKLYNIPFKIFLNWQIRLSQKAPIIGHVISAVLAAAVLCSSCDEFSTDAATITANQWLPGCAEDCVFTIQALHRCC